MMLSAEQYATISRFLRGSPITVSDLHGLTREQLEGVAGYMRARGLRAELAATTREAEAGKGAANVTDEQFADIYGKAISSLTARLEEVTGAAGPFGDGARFAMAVDVKEQR